MQIGRRGVEAGLDAQRPADLSRLSQALLQILFADDFREAFFEIRELFSYGSKGHFTIVNVRLMLLATMASVLANAQPVFDRFKKLLDEGGDDGAKLLAEVETMEAKYSK